MGGGGAAERGDDREATEGADKPHGGGGGVPARAGPGVHGAHEAARGREEGRQEGEEGEEEVSALAICCALLLSPYFCILYPRASVNPASSTAPSLAWW